MLGLKTGDGAVVATKHEAPESLYDGVVGLGSHQHLDLGALQVGVAEGLGLAVSHGLLSCVPLL